MCNEKKQENTHSTNVKNSDINIMINKQRKITTISSICTNESHSVDFQIHTNIELNYSKKMKVCFIISSIISFICISASFFATYKLNSELIEVHIHIEILNKKLMKLGEQCDNRVLTNEMLHEQNTKEEIIEPAELQVSNFNDTDYDYNSKDSLGRKYNRLRRANHRNKHGNRRVVKSSGSLAAHFKGSLPEIVIEDQGLIGPWYPDNAVARQYKFPRFHLTEGKCSIEVTEPALYFIYAQVYYITSNSVNSYSLYVRSEGSSQNNVIAKCSASGPNNSHVSEISCYTAAVYNLKANDRIFIKQTEKNRTIILRDGHSFFGIVRLNNSKRNRH